MRTLYVEGVATHNGSESCVGDREVGGEALTGVCAGWANEPRNHSHLGADAVQASGRQHRRQRQRKLSPDPARSKTPCMRKVSMRENREVPRSLVRLITGPVAQARSRP